VSCGRWRGASPSSANVLAVGTKPEQTLLYVKCRTGPPGFRGLIASRLSELNAPGKPRFIVLIVGSAETGYVASQSDVGARTSSGAWALSGDGDFKVNECGDPGGISHFRSFDAFLDLALPTLRGAAGR